MPTVLRKTSLIFAASLILAGSAAINTITAQTKPAPRPNQPTPSQSETTKPDTADKDDQGTPDDELDAAAVNLDVSRSSTLIQKLYQATRDTKEQDILGRLTEAKKLLADGADVKATDQFGRTALHWTVFGSSYNTKPSIIVSYEEMADQLIQKGVDINHEDIYNDTALDYLLYSPNFEIQTLLIEHGATSGFLIASFQFVQNELGEMPNTVAAGMAKSMKADLAPGQTMSIRLNGPVFSEHSRTGDPVEGTVTYPLCKGGENITCPPANSSYPPAPRSRPQSSSRKRPPANTLARASCSTFPTFIHADGSRSPLYARVIDVDRPHVPKTTANATGDVITTDGQLSIVELGATKPNIVNPATPSLQTRPAETSQ